MTLNATVTLADFVWESGKQLMDLEVILGSAEKSSTIKVTLSDPLHLIAAALINHSLSSGGIVALPGATAPTAIAATTNKNSLGRKPTGTTGTATAGSMAAKGAEFTPSVKAFLDAIVKRETFTATTDIAQSYYSKNGAGYFTDADVKAGGGFPLSQGRNQNIGRYQINRGDWDEANTYYGRTLNLSVASDQDLLGYHRALRRGSFKALAAGDIESAFTRASKEWVSAPWATIRPSQIQAGTTKKEYLDYYQQRLAFYSGQVAPVVTAKPQTIVAPAKATTTPEAVSPKPAKQSSTGTPVIKGSILSANIEGFAFDFYHQSTDMSDAGVTVIMGQGVRWAMSRRKRNRTLKDMKLSQLAALVCKAHKVTLDYQATIDPEYSHIDQSGQSDYALLLREVTENGLMITEKDRVVTILERKQLKPLEFTLARGLNLLSYRITDSAMSGKDDPMTQYLPQEAKNQIDPVEGKVVSKLQDVDRLKESNSVTGVGKTPTKGTVKGGTSQPMIEKALTKRISGLPSTFVVPLSVQSLSSTPLSSCVTEGFPEILNRIWAVSKVAHNLGANTTTYNLVSPVEVSDTEPADNKPTAVGGKNVATGAGWVYPVSGTVTSLQSPNRNGRPHNGCDIGAPNGTPIYAAGDGIVCTNAFQAAGAGNYVQIKHASGLFTAYFHMESRSPLATGTPVKAGQDIGKVGNTGHSFGNHLHFELLTSVAPGERLQVGKTFPLLLRKGAVTVAGQTV